MKKKFVIVILSILSFLVCYPIFFLLIGSLMGGNELKEHIAVLSTKDDGFITWSWLPNEPTFRSYVELLLDTPQFFGTFWNSIKITLGVLIGQMLVGIPAAWGFARYQFRFRRVLFMLYVILMIMPFLVVMLPQYLVLNQLGLLDTLWSIILPGMFSTFPIFIIHSFFRSIPESIIESARIDGASELRIFLKIGIPLSSGGIISAMILSFLEYWNLIEQPLVFLKDKSLWPLSLYLPSISLDQAGLAFSAAIFALIPSILIFLLGQNYLEQGIVATAVQE